MTSWMDLNGIMLSGIIQRNPVWSHVWNLKKKKKRKKQIVNKKKKQIVNRLVAARDSGCEVGKRGERV